MNKSIGPNLKYVQKIEEQEQMIQFLKAKYKEKTGFDAPVLENESQKTMQQQQQQSMVLGKSIILPQAKSINFGNQQEEEKNQEIFQTFFDAVNNLRLPTKIIPVKNKPIRSNFKTNIDLKSPYHIIEIIDLSNYANKNFNRMCFKEFLESLQDIRTLSTLILKNNGIDDSYNEELKYIITNTHVRNIDISHNEISSKGIEGFLQQLKEVNYFKSINLSRNNFSGNIQSLNLMCSAFQQQHELYHICVDAFKSGSVEYKGADAICKLICSHKVLKQHIISQLIRSVIIQDTHINDITKIATSLSSNTSHLTELTLKYCFLTVDHIKILSQALTNNCSLVYLNLQQNGLNDVSGHYLAQMIQQNNYLYQLDLEHNQLGNDFVFHIAESLKRNNVLNSLKLGFNSISDLKPLLQILGPENHSLNDLGNLQNNPIALAQVDQLQKRVHPSENKTNYTILKSINFIDSLSRTQQQFRVWNI